MYSYTSRCSSLSWSELYSGVFMDMDYVIEGTLPHMTVEGEVKSWTQAPNGGYIGIILSDDGNIYTVHSDDFAYQSDIPLVQKGSRVRFRYETFRNDDGDRIVGRDMETKKTYTTGGARKVELFP